MNTEDYQWILMGLTGIALVASNIYYGRKEKKVHERFKESTEYLTSEAKKIQASRRFRNQLEQTVTGGRK